MAAIEERTSWTGLTAGRKLKGWQLIPGTRRILSRDARRSGRSTGAAIRCGTRLRSSTTSSGMVCRSRRTSSFPDGRLMKCGRGWPSSPVFSLGLRCPFPNHTPCAPCCIALQSLERLPSRKASCRAKRGAEKKAAKPVPASGRRKAG